jgi:hypothetical protein
MVVKLCMVLYLVRCNDAFFFIVPDHIALDWGYVNKTICNDLTKRKIMRLGKLLLKIKQ